MMWPNMLFGIRSMLPAFKDPEVMAGNQGAGGVRVNPANDPEEMGMLRLRGYCSIFKGNISVVMYTNTNDVTITIPRSLGFASDYESLSKAVGLFMDSLELSMYAAR